MIVNTNNTSVSCSHGGSIQRCITGWELCETAGFEPLRVDDESGWCVSFVDPSDCLVESTTIPFTRSERYEQYVKVKKRKFNIFKQKNNY